jgi:hypothetical protein
MVASRSSSTILKKGKERGTWERKSMENIKGEKGRRDVWEDEMSR